MFIVKFFIVGRWFVSIVVIGIVVGVDLIFVNIDFIDDIGVVIIFFVFYVFLIFYINGVI